MEQVEHDLARRREKAFSERLRGEEAGGKLAPPGGKLVPPGGGAGGNVLPGDGAGVEVVKCAGKERGSPVEGHPGGGDGGGGAATRSGEGEGQGGGEAKGEKKEGGGEGGKKEGEEKGGKKEGEDKKRGKRLQAMMRLKMTNNSSQVRHMKSCHAYMTPVHVTARDLPLGPDDRRWIQRWITHTRTHTHTHTHTAPAQLPPLCQHLHGSNASHRGYRGTLRRARPGPGPHNQYRATGEADASAFRGGFASEAHRLVYHSAQGSRTF